MGLSSVYSQIGPNLSLEGSLLFTGISTENTWSHYSFNKKPTLGSKFAIEFGYNFTNEWGIYTGFGFMNLGQNYKREPIIKDYGILILEDSSAWDREVSLDYFMFPLMFKTIKHGNKVDFIFGGGINLAILYRANQLVVLNGSDYNSLDGSGGIILDGIVLNDSNIMVVDGSYQLSTWTDKEVTNRFKSLDIILNLETGLRFAFWENVYIDILANVGFGLTDINIEERKLPDNGSSHNLYGGLKLRFGLDNIWDSSRKNKL